MNQSKIPNIVSSFVSFNTLPKNETLFPKSENQNRILLIPRLKRKI
ncbi:hypothetical protein LEP1GSC161_1137 [Leptospira santarosai str. CBC1416]|uniref:Uncharacterized protein n=2 Tax=Leptospira santarosai TaxID=28183 RepID=A0A0E2BIM0_9LEPT|nr:hypothetical protein LEP1GSC179_2930 [Leptospira santarosai str. MOR084]EMJ47762.1 hypothetical protein LEP1GSC169_3622 [Leptospira santarosai str. HAI1349]EMM87534.1 hypothetical protein LEP1GSC039_2363 [Leptospira santarosai str. 2000027870]EMO12680.1 hypothetical protein LEP1GSC165_3707 [Leptospira santarosai str. CBC523]EMO22894.1 hypothetical protein LEP1GSC168_1797 [Leptospira santarosai str. HAI134]EMO33496.1 hypothetical protein LEP1GSC175_2447 [Leptospira santarosai str. HAI821]EM